MTDNVKKGYDIAAKSDRSDQGFIDSKVSLMMTSTNAAGMENSRSLDIKRLEKEDENVGDKSLITFKSPADINGTTLLSHAKILDPDNQWIYLPALKRVKRISSVNKSGPFVGSEFAFEDLTASELNKYRYEYLRTEACGDLQCDVIKRIPVYQYSGYKKQLAWIDQTFFQIRKIDFYDRKDALLKTLLMADYREYPGHLWRAHIFTMNNHQNKKKTILKYSQFVFKIGLRNRDFLKSSLKRRR
jgi:hypothetical protein